MKAYDRIYQALLDSQKDDKVWKKKVDDTFKKFVDDGMTPTQAMKHTAMLLNEERTPISTFTGFFLKAYQTRNGVKLANIVVDGDAVVLSGENDFVFPDKPCGLKGKKLSKVRNLMSGNIYYEMTDATVFETMPLDVEALIGVAKNIDDVENETYALVSGAIVELKAWKEPMVTPDKLNLKLNFRSASVRSGFFVSDWKTVETVLPSEADLKRFNELIDDSQFDEAVSFFNDVCSEQWEHKIPGMDILLFGKVVDNVWKDRDGNERIGKNIRISVGGFVYSVDALFDGNEEDTGKPVKPKKAKKAEPEPEADDEDEGDPFDQFVDTPAPEPETKTAEPEADDEAEGDLEEKLLAILKKSTKGLSPNEIKEKIDAPPKVIADMLSSMMDKKIIALSSGKFQVI